MSQTTDYAALYSKALHMYDALMQISIEACFISDAKEAVELLAKLGDIASKAITGVGPSSVAINELKRDKARIHFSITGENENDSDSI